MEGAQPYERFIPVTVWMRHVFSHCIASIWHSLLFRSLVDQFQVFPCHCISQTAPLSRLIRRIFIIPISKLAYSRAIPHTSLPWGNHWNRGSNCLETSRTFFRDLALGVHQIVHVGFLLPVNLLSCSTLFFTSEIATRDDVHSNVYVWRWFRTLTSNIQTPA